MNYEIRIRGCLGATMRRAFPGLRAQIQGQDTLLRGDVADQAALHGVLAQVEALGLELLEVRRRPDVPRGCDNLTDRAVSMPQPSVGLDPPGGGTP